MLVLMVPKLDSRQLTVLLDSEQRQGTMLEQHIEAELANDPANDLMWWRRLHRAIEKWAPPGQHLILVTSEGRIIGVQRQEVQWCVTLSANRITPISRKRKSMAG